MPKAPFGKNWISTCPGYQISLDILAQLNIGPHMLTVIDHFSRHYPMSRVTTDIATGHLLATHGRTAVVLADLRKQFKSFLINSTTIQVSN